MFRFDDHLKATGVLLSLWSVGILVIVGISCANEPTPLEIPPRLAIPEEFRELHASPNTDLKPIPRLELVVPVGDVSPLACPLDASVIVNAMEGQTTFICSGTCVDSSNGVSTILTCAHEFRGLKNPALTIIHQKKEYPAKLLRKDDANDLAVLEVNASLPMVELAGEKPKVGDRVISIGLKQVNSDELGEQSHVVTIVDRFKGPGSIETDGAEWIGRSGGGLFLNGSLCGVIQGYTGKTLRRGLYVSIEPIREILQKSAIRCESCAVEQYGSPGSRRLVKAYSLERCVNCKQERESKGEGSLATKIDWTDEPIPDWIRKKLPRNYLAPVYVWQCGDGRFQWPRSSDHVTMDQLDLWTEQANATMEPVEASSGQVEVGAAIAGKAVIEQAFDFIDQFAGTECEATFVWHREGGLDAMPIGKSVSLQEFCGTSGSIELTVTTTKKVPIHAVKFDYKWENGKFFVRAPDWVEVQIPEDGTVGATSKPVGSVMLAYTILSIGYNIYSLLHPSADVFIGSDLSMSAKYASRRLSVDCGPNPPSVRLHWQFLMGLLRFEYSRPFTGAIVAADQCVMQFHKSRLFRDVNMEVK